MITKREAAIISAYTNYLLGEFSDMHEYIEEIMGRPIYTHEMVIKATVDEIQEKSKDDFINLKVEVEEVLIDWEEAEEHFYFIKGMYEEIPEGKLALIMFIEPTARRYEAGERTKELYEDMMSAE